MMPTTNSTAWIREHVHNLLPLLGALVGVGGIVHLFLGGSTDPMLHAVDLGFGALGLAVTTYSKNINSSSFTAIQVAEAQKLALNLPPNVQDQLTKLEVYKGQLEDVLAQLRAAVAVAPQLAPPPTPGAPTPAPGATGGAPLGSGV